MNCDEVVSARSFLGTKWVHQGRTKGVALDCIGLIIEVARETGCTDAVFNEPYGRMPDGHRLKAECDARLDKLWETDEEKWMTPGKKLVPWDLLQDGTIPLMAWRKFPIHMGFVAQGPFRPHLIHCFAVIGKAVEHGLDEEWRGRIKALYRFKR